MSKRKLRFKKYVAGILLVVVVAALVGLLKLGNLDKLKGTIKVKDVYLSNVSTKLNANIFDVSSDSPVISNGYDEVKYQLKYKLSESNQVRDVIITGTLDSDNGYASFKRLTGDNITSTLSNDNRQIEIVISDLPADTEITTNIALTINGAPNGYTVKPTFKIKESTAENYTDVYTNPIEVSTNSLRGTVRNLEGEPIPNIIITAYKGRRLIKETYTNQNGEYIFSDLPEDNYDIKINEEIYKDVSEKQIIVSGDTRLDLTAERVYPFKIEVHKYITKVDAINLGTPILRTYDKASTVALPIKKLTNFSGRIYYSIVVENTGSKEGIVSVVKDEMPSFMAFDETINPGFELKDGIIYDRNLEGIVLQPGEKIEDTLVLDILNTNAARTYLNRVNALGEIYDHVVYILNNDTYKEEDVLEGETTTRPDDPVANFGGWYTDSEYTNLYNFNNPVTKDLILYGKTGQKYTVEFYDKNPENGDEDLYRTNEVESGNPVEEPNTHPEYTGYDFDYWCTVDFNEYVFSTPVTSNLKLITCYTIKEYNVNFYNYQYAVEKTTKVEYKHLIDQNTAPTFDETGYSFICWTTDKENCFDFTTPIVEDIDLYPKHERLNNAIIFNDENRTTTVEVPYGDKATPIADQGKEGHEFRCWSEDRTNCFDFNTPIISDTTVYAIYDINHFNVTFIDRNPETLEDTQYGETVTVEWNSTVARPTTDPNHTGYTFSEWTKNDETTYNFNTPVTGDLTLISKYNINTYPVRFHDGNTITTKNVEYKQKVTPITSPTKEHHVFKNWLDENDSVFDFNTLIVEERDLYSSYEEILAPTISHAPTMWTNSSVTVTVNDNANLSDNTGYSYLYKTSETNYSTYTTPFAVSENTTIIAKASKENVDSVVTNHEIVNIDKLNPSITLFSENTASRNVVVLNVSAIDNESGVNYYEVYQNNVKIGEKHLECYNETTFDGYESCRSNFPDERVTTYQVTGLTQSTTYTFKVNVCDKAGNCVMSDDLEVTTTTPRIVARLIGYNNQLFTDTIDENTGDVITPKEDKYINFESLEEAFDYEDLYDCKNVQCTIQMVTSTNESVEVLAGQDLTLDLNGKIVAGISEDYTIRNNGAFTLIESTPEGSEPGQLINNQGIALLNKAEAHLTLGEGYADRQVASSTVSVTRPYVYGETVGVKNETNGYFILFDGQIVAPASQTPGYGAVNGKVTGAEYSYTPVSNSSTINERTYQIVTLNKLTSPEARINNMVYYGTLSSAMDDANRGVASIDSADNSVSLMSELKPAAAHYFKYDDVTGTWISDTGVYDENTGAGIGHYNSDSDHAKSYLVIDLRDETSTKVLKVDYSVENDQYYNPTNHWISLKPVSVNKYDDYINGVIGEEVDPFLKNKQCCEFELAPGEIYIVNFDHYIPDDANYSNTYTDVDGWTVTKDWGEMTISNITLNDIDKNIDNIANQEDVSFVSYGFYYDATDKTIKSNNQYLDKSSLAYGYTEVDLTDKSSEEYYDIIVNATMESYYTSYDGSSIKSEGRVNVADYVDGIWGNSIITWDDSRYYEYLDYLTTDPRGGFNSYGPKIGSARVQGGKVYYIKYFYRKSVGEGSNVPTREEYETAGCRDQIIINTIDVVKVNDEYTTNIDVKSLRNIDNTIMDDLVENSNGGVIREGDTVRTNFTGISQNIDTYAVIDLTNDTSGKMLAVDFNKISASGYGTIDLKENSYYSGEYNCTNCFYVFQKQTYYDGSEYWGAIKGNKSIKSVDGGKKDYFIYMLPAGHEYRIKLNATSPSSAVAPMPNIVFNSIKLYESSSFEGNYFTGLGMWDNDYDVVSNWFETGANDELAVVSGNLKARSNTYKDSFIKIDLTNYEKNQLLKLNVGSNYGVSKGMVYLTNNNRAIPEDEFNSNRGNALLYDFSYCNGPSNCAVVLEKGKVYYLHFADSLNAYQRSREDPYWGEISTLFSSLTLYDISLVPVEESLMTIGTPTILTGTYDVTGEREEGTTIKKRTSSVPIINGNNSVTGFEYNSETGWYTAMTDGSSAVAMQKIKIDLTGKTNNVVYTIDTNYVDWHNTRGYYLISEEEDELGLDLNMFIDNGNSTNYTDIEQKTGIELEKGKIYYLSIVSSTSSTTTNPFKFKLTEMDTANPTTEYYPISKVKEFNTHVDTVQLLRNVNTPNTLTVDSSEEVVLDLNGYSLTSTEDYVIDNKGDLTILDTKYERTLLSYDSDLAEYQEYAGLCDGCEPSDEYKFDHLSEYMDYFGIVGGKTEFSYTGDVQTFTAPATGLYQLQVWGAQGGYRYYPANGGKGGYSEGTIELQEGETLYIYVGGSGNAGGTAGGFNGGGSRGTYAGGGGATDIRVEGDSLYNRIIVAGGGGSDGATNKPGKAGGGLEGISATESYGSGGSAGTQTYGGDYYSAFGLGGSGTSQSGGYGGAGGGGWYGGGGAMPDGSGDDDRGGGGGSGFVYTDSSTSPVSGYLVQNHILTNAYTVDGTNENIPTYDGTGTMTGNSGNGYAVITTLPTEEQLNEIRSNLPKTYDVKEEPILGAKSIMTNDSGISIIKNEEDAELAIKNVILEVGSEYGIYNEGTITTIEDPVINVKTNNSTGIFNMHNGEIVNNGNLEINIVTPESACYNDDEREYRATGISYTNGTHTISNIKITGTNGTGIKVDENTIVNIKSSNINVVESTSYVCNVTKIIRGDVDGERFHQMLGETLEQAINSYKTSNYFPEIWQPYRNDYEFRGKTVRYTSQASHRAQGGNRNDAAVYNKGTANITDGTTLVGSVKNFGKTTLNDGSSFDEVYQMDTYVFKYDVSRFDNVETNIYNTVSNISQIINLAGTINIIEEEGQTSKLTSTNRVSVYNFGTFNTSGGEMPNVLNMGEFNSNNTDYEKFYNLNTIKYIYGNESDKPIGEGRFQWGYSVQGVANITGGTLNDVVNEYNMTLNGTTVPNGIINRGNLVVKGNSVITGPDKPAILNAPMFDLVYKNNNNGYPKLNGLIYGKTSLTIGDNDGNVTDGPTITTTNNSYAVTGYCNAQGTTGVSDLEYSYFYLNSVPIKTYSLQYHPDETYADFNGNVRNSRTDIVDSVDYPDTSNTLCSFNYYDGTISNTSTTDITDVVDIPITGITSGYDVLYSNNNSTASVSLATIDDSSRSLVITANGNSYRSLETAISEAPDNSIINITGNYDTANRVTIPADKNLTINYLLGATLNSYSKDALITNNGNLTVAGDGTNNVLGEFAYENNNVMTFNGSNNTNNEDFYFKQSNIVKNNSDLTINNINSSRLDIVSTGESEDNKSTVTINDGTFDSNTIQADNSDILIKKAYFVSTSDNNFNETYTDDNLSDLSFNTKPILNVKNSIVTFDNFDVDTDSRYSNISLEQNIGRLNKSTLNLNNTKYGGKSSISQLYTTLRNGSNVNINDGTYDKVTFRLFEGNHYNQTAGTVNGGLLVSGSGNVLNITGGKINTTAEAGILLYDASGTSITAGTKGDLIEGTENLKVSKTDPEIRGGTFGITSKGTYSSPNALYFYDGIFKGNGNPIDLYVEDIETGYDVVYNRSASPQEKYLDYLPLVLNYTTGVYYYDAQEAFDNANTNDELIWVRDYTNFADTPTLVVNDTKKFKLYFSYMKAENTPYYLGQETATGPVQNEFKPYSGTETVPSGYTTNTDLIKINNEDMYDAVNDVTIKATFMINNGDLEIIGTQKGLAGAGSIFESLSGAAIIDNTGTLKVTNISAVNIKGQGTMFKNTGTLTVKKGGFETQQATVFDNYGILNIVGDDSDTTSCYRPTYIKVDTSDALESAYNSHAMMSALLGVSIINNTDATMNIDYLYYDSDYAYNAIVNNGTLNIRYANIEQFKDSSPNLTVAIDRPLINNGTMTANSLNIYSPHGILNTGDLTYSGGIFTGYDNAITNTGTLNVTGMSISGAGKGIFDTGNTTFYGGISTYEEAYYGIGNGTTTIKNTGLGTYGKNTESYNYSNTVSMTCSNDSWTSKTINAKLWYYSYHDLWKYTQNNAAVYVGVGRTFNFESGGIYFMGLSKLEHFCGKYRAKNGVGVEECLAPYNHAGETGRNYTIAGLEAENATVNLGTSDASGSISAPIASGTYGLYLKNSTFTQLNGYVGSSYIENTNEDVTIGVLDDQSNPNAFSFQNASCASGFKGLNLYDGNVQINPDNFCKFNDKEPNYVIYGTGENYYSLGTDPVIVNTSTGTEYTSIPTAILAATAGDTLQLEKSPIAVNSEYDITIDKDLTLDLHGYTLSANINVTSGNVTITDAAYIANNEYSRGRLIDATNTSGTLNINGIILNNVNNASTMSITNATITNISNTGTLSIDGGSTSNLTNNGTTTLTGTTINKATNNGTSSLSLINSSIIELKNYDTATITMDNDSRLDTLYNYATLTLSSGNIGVLENYSNLTINGANVTNTLDNTSLRCDDDEWCTGTLVVNSGTIGHLKGYAGHVKYDVFIGGATINGGTIDRISQWAGSCDWYEKHYGMTINDGTIGSITNMGCTKINGGQIDRGIINGSQYLDDEYYSRYSSGFLTLGNKDGNVNDSSPVIKNNNGYALTSDSNSEVYYYDGIFTSNKPIVIDATIKEVETGYTTYVSTDYDEHGDLTGTYSMTLIGDYQTSIKIACVDGICYDTIQEAIDASVRNYTVDDGCSEVVINGEYYFAVELDADLVLDPQYTVSINLNYHNLNDNGHIIPENIILRNGSRNGSDLQSSLSKFLADIFDTDEGNKNIIITKMSDGNALDTSKTYNLYKYDNGEYKLLSVNSDEAGKYRVGSETTELKSIKGRIYINNLGVGDYMLKDNLDNELEFNIYENGTLSSNIRENITSNYGRMSASAVATLIVSIQTGQFRIGYVLIGLLVITLIIILLLNIKRKSKKETI